MCHVQVNVPYPMLVHRLDFAVKNRIHPEIYFSGEDLDNCRLRDVERIAEAFEQNGFEATIHGPFMDLSPGGVDRRVKEVTLARFTRTLELAPILRPKMVVFHAGYEKWKFDGDVKLWLGSSLETWRQMVEKAGEMGLTLAIENVFEETPESLVSLLEEINSPHFRFCFDTGHYNVFSFRKAPLQTWIESLGPYLGEVHLHDNGGEMDDHLPAGEGTFDFDVFFRLLSECRRNPIFTIEPHREEHLCKSLEALKRYF